MADRGELKAGEKLSGQRLYSRPNAVERLPEGLRRLGPSGRFMLELNSSDGRLTASFLEHGVRAFDFSIHNESGCFDLRKLRCQTTVLDLVRWGLVWIVWVMLPDFSGPQIDFLARLVRACFRSGVYYVI